MLSLRRERLSVYADVKNKKDIRHVFSDGYDLVQEGALYLCEHYGRHLNDVIGYTKKGKAVTIRMACIKKMMKQINRKTSDYYRSMGTDKKRAPVIDEDTAPIVRRIFEMYASGISPRRISEILNLEGIPSPAAYAYTQTGQKPKPNVMGLWTAVTIFCLTEGS